MKVGADPTRRVDNSLELCGNLGFLARFDDDFLEDRVVLRAVADHDLIVAWPNLLAELAVVTVVQVFHCRIGSNRDRNRAIGVPFVP